VAEPTARATRGRRSGFGFLRSGSEYGFLDLAKHPSLRR
jgi:hypothetical protein